MGDTRLGDAGEGVHLARRDPPLGEHIARALHETGAGCRDDDPPAVREELADMRGGAVDVALEGRDGGPGHPDQRRRLEGGIDVDEALGRGIRLS